MGSYEIKTKGKVAIITKFNLLLKVSKRILKR